MDFHQSILQLFNPAEILRIIEKSALQPAIGSDGKVNQILVLTDTIDADIYVSSQSGEPALIYSFSEGPIHRDRFLQLLNDSATRSVLEVWHADA
ncbi:hypothetical protein [Actimicrobium antarcticum]|uniref:Uncharacterized protein n=1 Tax=Actimicrobium antarcticum TaxID=1051899 RepID=A0ABP7TRV3_9BURK